VCFDNLDLRGYVLFLIFLEKNSVKIKKKSHDCSFFLSFCFCLVSAKPKILPFGFHQGGKRRGGAARFLLHCHLPETKTVKEELELITVRYGSDLLPCSTTVLLSNLFLKRKL
jgi:hypothetical protein